MHKNRLRRQFQRLRDPNIKQEINYLTRLIKALINSIKSERWEKTLRKITPNNPKNMWQIAKHLKNKNNSNYIPALQSKNGLVTSEIDKANTIAETLYETHRQTINMSDTETNLQVERAIQEFHKTNQTTPIEGLTNPKQIKRLIKLSNKNKAPGEDQVTNKILKNLPQKSLLQLYYIINSCLKIQYYPNVWKNAIIIPFKKPNKNHSHPVNYRPISLLPTMGKILEKVVLEKLKSHEKTYNTIIPEQFGFRPNHSTIHQLSRITDKITTNYNINKCTTLLTLDIEKAFDTVWHNGLIYKLTKNNLPTYLIKIIYSFLQNRTFQIRINKTVSNKFNITAGVPQGAILSPTLFLYFINDIPKHQNTQLALFADDTAILTESTQIQQCNKYIQRHITELERYFEKWKIKINTNKTALTYFTHKKIKNIQPPITFYNNPINPTTHTKYLGIQLDQRLKFNVHLKEIIKKAKAAIAALSPLLRYENPLPQKTKLNLYKIYIRPILLYGCPIYSNISKSNINKIQIIQNKVLRLILKKGMDTRIQDLHKISNLPYIEDKIYEIANKFFNHTIKLNQTTKHIASINPENAPFRIKHKLSHHIIYA